MMSKTVSDQLIEMLTEAGVKRVYGITGDSLNPVNDAIRRSGNLQWVHVRHEESAAYAASMDAELHGIGCCMGSSGPGHVHLINGLYDANRSGNPVIAIASTVHTEKFGTDYFQETKPQFLFSGASKYNEIASTPMQAVTMLQRAIQVATNEKGVAVLGLPGDLAAAPAEKIKGKESSMFANLLEGNTTARIVTSQRNYTPTFLYRPTDEQIDLLANLLNADQKITLYCGHGCRYAVEEVEQLAEKLKAPIAFSFRGKIFFDKENSSYTAGMNGLLGNPAGFDACNDADILILLGTDFPYAEFLPHGKTIIQIDQDTQKIGRRAMVTHAFAGDIRDTLAALLPKINTKNESDFIKKINEKYQKDQQKIHPENPTLESVDDHVNPEAAAVLINELASDNAIFTVDTGMTCVWAARLLKSKNGRYLTGSFNHGSMANALPMAIGAAASTPERQVVAMCGDGGISMLLGDLATIMQYQWPIKIIVFNNRSLGMVKLEMEVAGLVDWQTDMVNPPFEKIAELMHIKGIAIHNGSQLEAGLREAFSHEGPVLVNIYTDPNTLAMPPKITIEQMKGFATTVAKKVLEGEIDDASDMIKAGFKTL